MPPVHVKHIMTANVVTFFEEQTLPLAEEIMGNKHFRHLPVIGTDGRLVGLISRSDVYRAQISALVGLTDSERRARQSNVTVRQVMSHGIATVTPDTLASDAARLLLDRRIGCLPVIDDFGILRGIVTERDFLRFALKTLAMHDHDGESPHPAVESDTAVLVTTRNP